MADDIGYVGLWKIPGQIMAFPIQVQEKKKEIQDPKHKTSSTFLITANNLLTSFKWRSL